MTSSVRLLVCCCLWLSLLNKVSAQHGYPEIGKQCPDFLFSNVSHFSKDRVSLSDFKGKWLVMDFWTVSCSSCLKSFPKLRDLQKSFGVSVQFLLVGTDANRDGSMYERLFKRYELSIPCAYDSAIFKRFGIDSVPHLVIVDPNGLVYAITTTQFLDSVSLQKMIAGEKPYFETKLNTYQKEALNKIKIDSALDKQTENIHQSSLSVWKKGEPINIVTNINRTLREGYYKTSATSIQRLYNVAYLGRSDWGFGDSLYYKFWKTPVIETSDSIKLNHNLDLKVLYNYYLKVPMTVASKPYVQWAMQCDLRKFFGFKVSVEVRQMPCLKLVRIKSSKSDLSSNGGNPISLVAYDGLTLSNCPMNRLLEIFSGYNPALPPLIDTTGITGNINITMRAILTDIKEIRRSLNDNGLDLIESTERMKVLVLKDRMFPATHN